MQKYLAVCPEYVRRYFLGEKTKNGLKLLSEIIDGVICSEDETGPKDRSMTTTTMWNFPEN